MAPVLYTARLARWWSGCIDSLAGGQDSRKKEYRITNEGRSALQTEITRGQGSDYLQFMRIQEPSVCLPASSYGATSAGRSLEEKPRNQRVHSLRISLAMMELIVGFINVAMIVLNNPAFIYRINFTLGLLLIGLGIFFLMLSIPVRRKIAKLQNDKLIRE